MKHLLSAAFAAAAYAIAAISPANATTYNVDFAIGSAALSGAITTNGDIGILQGSDFLGWDITMDIGSDSYTFTESNSEIYSYTDGYSGLVASATQLTFDFDDLSGSASPFKVTSNEADQISTYICLDKFNICTNSSSDALARFFQWGSLKFVNVAEIDTFSGTQVFAAVSPVPLPAGAPLLLTGIGGFALLRRKQKR